MCELVRVDMTYYTILLVDLLGERMETELGGQYQDSASLCYICSGNVEKFLDAWYKLVC